MAPVSVVVIGAGERGSGYARWAARHPDRASVVAVAEPREVRRARFAAEHGVAERGAPGGGRGGGAGRAGPGRGRVGGSPGGARGTLELGSFLLLFFFIL